MEKKTKTVEIVSLVAADGMWLTQSANVPIEERVFSKTLYLGKNDTPANWHEVDDAYKAEIEAEVAAIEAEQIAAMEG